MQFFQSSYRRKPDIFGVDALFRINLAPTDDKGNVLGTIHVGDRIRVTKDEPNFWRESSLDQ